jgi:DNA-binding transcriptional ArsR family regulator
MGGDDSPVRSLPDAGDWFPSRSSGDVAPPPDALFSALANATRRRVTWYLLGESPASVDELADVLAGWRLDDQTTVGPDDHENIVAALHHSHLPVLDEAGLVDYHRDDATVEVASLAPVVEDTVRFAQAYDAAFTGQR